MKMFILPAILLFSFNAHAKSEASICEGIRANAYMSCMQNMCEDAVAENGGEVNECLNSGDGDLHEGASECAYEESKTMVQGYNKKHPRKKISCDEY